MRLILYGSSFFLPRPHKFVSFNYGLILDTRPKALPIVLTIEYGPMMNGCRIGFKCLDQWPTSSQWPVAAGHKHSSKGN